MDIEETPTPRQGTHPILWAALILIVFNAFLFLGKTFYDNQKSKENEIISISVDTSGFLPVTKVDTQPLISATNRLLGALNYVGAPIREKDRILIEALLKESDSEKVISGIQGLLDSYCVASVHINPESRVKVDTGPVEKKLVQQGWRTFLVKVHNEAGITPQLIAESPNAAPQYRRSTGSKSPSKDITMADVAQRWLALEMVNGRPLNPRLSGLALEYRILQLYSRDAGQREATLAFHVGQGTQDIGFRNETAILFNCE
jgi:hypothetical protein